MITDKDAEKIKEQIKAMQSRWADDVKQLLVISSTYTDALQPHVLATLLETLAGLQQAAIASLPGDSKTFLHDQYMATSSPLKGFV